MATQVATNGDKSTDASAGEAKEKPAVNSGKSGNFRTDQTHEDVELAAPARLHLLKVNTRFVLVRCG